MKNKITLLLLTVSVLLMTGCSRRPETYTGNGVAMGTIYSETIYVKKASDYQSDTGALLAKLETEVLSRRVETSEVGRLNAGAGQECRVSEDIINTLTVCRAIYEDSRGALDITLGRLISLWQIDEKAAGAGTATVPAQAEIDAALQAAGFDKVRTEGDTVTLPRDMELDLGAVGKGLALDKIAARLQSDSAVSGAVVTLGGSVLTYGSKPDGSAWKISVANPLHPEESIGTLTLTGTKYVSTSGDYERYFEAEGQRFHHILDPATGYPARSGLTGVTIVADNGLYSDALSTACFVLGADEGLQLADKYGVEALFVDTVGNITMTDGMRAIFRENSH